MADKSQKGAAADAGERLCRVKQKRVRTADTRHHFPKYPNLIRGMVISQLNQVWLADIIYIRIGLVLSIWQ